MTTRSALVCVPTARLWNVQFLTGSCVGPRRVLAKEVCNLSSNMRSATSSKLANNVLSTGSRIGNNLAYLHARIISSARCYTSSTAAASSPATQHQQQEPSTYIHPSLNAPLFQERINSDGSLTTVPQLEQQWRQQHHQQPSSHPTQPSSSSTSSSQQQTQHHEGHSRAPGVPAAAPAAAPISQQQLDQLVDLIQAHQRVVVVTGAGCSTESNIPDYRGPRGAYTTGKCWEQQAIGSGWGDGMEPRQSKGAGIELPSRVFCQFHLARFALGNNSCW